MKTPTTLALLLGFFLAGASGLPAQERVVLFMPQTAFPDQPVLQPRVPASHLWLAGGGGAVLGALAGGVAGYGIAVSQGCRGEFCGLGGIVIGLTLGEIVGAPLGVHLANGRRGPLGVELTASAVVALVGLTVPYISGSGLIFWSVPLAQIATAIHLERRGEKAFARDSQ